MHSTGGGQQPGPSWREETHLIEETPPVVEEIMIEERIPERRGVNIERVIIGDPPSLEDDDDCEEKLVIDEDADEDQEAQIALPEIKTVETTMVIDTPENADMEAQKVVLPKAQKVKRSKENKDPFDDTVEDDCWAGIYPPGDPPMRWGIAVHPRREHLYILRPIAPPPPGAKPGEYLTEGETVINPPQTRRNTKWRKELHKAFTDEKTFSLRQTRRSANKIAQGIYRMKRSAGTVAGAIDLRVATCREVASLHVNKLEEAEIEPDWDNFWLSSETHDSSFEQSTPGKITKPVEGSTASESASTPSPSPEQQQEEEEYVDILSTSFETPILEIVGPEDIEDEEEIEIDVVSIDDEEEKQAVVSVQKPEIPVEVEKEPEVGKARSLSSDSFVSPHRPGVRSAILISVEDAPPPPPTRGRPRKRSNQSNNLGSRPVPAITTSSEAVPGKRRYRRKNAPQEPQVTVGQAEVAPDALPLQPVVKAPRGRKRKMVDVPILLLPEEEPKPLKSRRETSTGPQNLQSIQKTTSLPSGSRCKLTIKFGPDLSIPVNLAVKEKVPAPGEKLMASEVRAALPAPGERMVVSEVKVAPPEVKLPSEAKLATVQQPLQPPEVVVLPKHAPPAKIIKQRVEAAERARRAREAKKAADQTSEVSEAIRSPSKLLEFMENVARDIQKTTPRLDSIFRDVEHQKTSVTLQASSEAKKGAYSLQKAPQAQPIFKTPEELQPFPTPPQFWKSSEARKEATPVSHGLQKATALTELLKPIQPVILQSKTLEILEPQPKVMKPLEQPKSLQKTQLLESTGATKEATVAVHSFQKVAALPKLLEPVQPISMVMASPQILKTSDELLEYQPTPAKMMKPSEVQKPDQKVQKTSAKLLEPPRPEKATPVSSSHVLGSEATVMQLLEELNYPAPDAPVEIQKPVKERRGRKKQQEVIQKAPEVQPEFVRPIVPLRADFTSSTSKSPGRKARMMHPESREDLMFTSPQKVPPMPKPEPEQRLSFARFQELTSVAAKAFTEPQQDPVLLPKTPRKSRKTQEAEVKEPRKARQGRTPAKRAEGAEPDVTPVKETKSRQKKQHEEMDVEQPTEVVEEDVKSHVEQLNQLERLVKEMITQEAFEKSVKETKKGRKHVEEPSTQTANASSHHGTSHHVTFEEPTTSRGRRGKKEHIQPRTSSRTKKAEKRPESPVPLEILRQISLMEKGNDMADDNVSTFSEDVGMDISGFGAFSAPPVQYQFSPGRRTRPVPKPPVIDLEIDNDVSIISPPRQEESDDDIQVLSQKGCEIVMQPVKIEEPEEDEDEPVVMTDREYDEDGVDDPPLGGDLIDACDYMQLDADNEICEDYLPFPPDKVRVDPGVFFDYVKCLSLNIYNLILPHKAYPFMHYSTDFAKFLEDISDPPLAEIKYDEPDPQALVNEAFCHMSLQATQLLTHDPHNKKKLVTSIKLKEMIKMFLTRNNQLKELAFPLFESEEENLAKEFKEAWKVLERNILLRLCDSLLSMVKETKSWKGPVTDNVFRRRFEAILIGWRNFFMRGGPLKLYFNTVLPVIGTSNVNKTFEDWIARHDVIIDQIKVALDLGAERRTTALMAEMEAQGMQMRWQQSRQDVGTEATELHRYECPTCKIFFTERELLRAHEQVHNFKPHSCEICYLDFTYRTSLYIHYLQRHFEEILLGEITA